MSIKYSNNAGTTLSLDLSKSVTTINVTDTSEFPTLGTGDYAYLTLSNVLGTGSEIVKVTGKTATSFTGVSRAQDGTTALEFGVGDKIELRITAKLLDELSAGSDSLHEWQWKWKKWNGFQGTNSDSAFDMEYWLNNHFIGKTATPDLEGYLDTRTEVVAEGGFGGSAYGNMFGNLDNYHVHIYTNIYVEDEFTLPTVNLNGDDPFALLINGAYVMGRASCCVNMPYTYTFTQGWHRLDLIYSEGGGGDYIKLGWNPKDYSQITAMSPTFGSGNAHSYLPLAGATMTGDITLEDTKALVFEGTDAKGRVIDNLKIYSDGIHSYIKEINPWGNLTIQASHFHVKSASGKNAILANNAQDVSLWYNGDKKLATTSTGIDVTGRVDASSGLRAEGASLVQKYSSAWSYTTHDVLYNGWTSSTGDYTYVKAAGNSNGPHGQLIVGDNLIAFGSTDSETGVIVDSATVPFNKTTYGYINSTGLTVNGTVDCTDITGIAPTLTGSLSEVEDADGVQLSWTKSADTVDFYEVWSSVTETDEYVLIGKVLSSDVSTSTVEMTDDGYDTSSTTIYYKVFAVNKGSYSNALSTSIDVSNTVLDPTNLIVVPVTGAYMVQYDLPNDPKFSNVTIKRYADATEAGANNEDSATVIYTGERDTFVYEVPSADSAKYHKFWVSSNTRI